MSLNNMFLDGSVKLYRGVISSASWLMYPPQEALTGAELNIIRTCFFVSTFFYKKIDPAYPRIVDNNHLHFNSLELKQNAASALQKFREQFDYLIIDFYPVVLTKISSSVITHVAVIGELEKFGYHKDNFASVSFSRSRTIYQQVEADSFRGTFYCPYILDNFMQWSKNALERLYSLEE